MRELKEKEARETTDEREANAVEASTEGEDIEIAVGIQNTTVQELGDVAAGGHGTSGLPNSTSKLVFADTSALKGPEIQRKMLLHNYKLFAELRHSKRPAKIIDSGELNSKTTSSIYDTAPTAEVKQTIETLKSSSTELQASVEDLLPNVTCLSVDKTEVDLKITGET